MLKETSDLLDVSISTAANPSYGNGIDVLVYEGGWSLVAGSDSALNALYISAQSDSRMYTVFKTLLKNSQTNGVKLFINFTDIAPHVDSPYGFDWGTLLTVLQSPSQRFSALTDFTNNV